LASGKEGQLYRKNHKCTDEGRGRENTGGQGRKNHGLTGSLKRGDRALCGGTEKLLYAWGGPGKTEQVEMRVQGLDLTSYKFF